MEAAGDISEADATFRLYTAFCRLCKLIYHLIICSLVVNEIWHFYCGLIILLLLQNVKYFF